jgi:predicted small secreted protein
MPEQTPAPVSPTGQPIVPAWLAPYIFIAATVVAAMIAAGSGQSPAIPALADWSGWLGLLDVLLLGLLGLTPGARRTPTLMALVLVGALTLTACASMQRVGRAALDCAEPGLAQAASTAVGPIFDALTGPTSDWSATVDRLVLAAGDAGICAFKQVIAELQSRPSPKPPPGSSVAAFYAGAGADELRLLRARRWAAANGVEVE